MSVNQTNAEQNQQPGTATPARYPFHVDRHGFPLVDCSRCRGSGYLVEYSHVNGGVCAKCGGRKRIHPRGRVGEIAGDFYGQMRGASRAVMGTRVEIAGDGSRRAVWGVRVGDMVHPEGIDAGPWREVTGVRVTRRVVGWCDVSGRTESIDLETFYTFADGSTYAGWGSLWRRRLDVPAMTALRDRMAAESREAYAQAAARRGRRKLRPALSASAELVTPVNPWADLAAAHV